jgi:hypothetical protein
MFSVIINTKFRSQIGYLQPAKKSRNTDDFEQFLLLLCNCPADGLSLPAPRFAQDKSAVFLSGKLRQASSIWPAFFTAGFDSQNRS